MNSYPVDDGSDEVALRSGLQSSPEEGVAASASTGSISATNGSLYGGGPHALHRAAATILGQCESVLDVGCGRGYLGQLLACDVDGVELDSERAKEARVWCRRVFEVSAEDDLLVHRVAGPYDAVVFIDSLEHFTEPPRVLNNCLSVLNPQGKVLAIIPNVAHISQRLKMLRGQWAYQDEGLLDRTHLRFFTWDTSAEMLEQSGLKIVDRQAILAVPRLLRWLPPALFRRWPNLFAKHTVLIAKRK